MAPQVGVAQRTGLKCGDHQQAPLVPDAVQYLADEVHLLGGDGGKDTAEAVTRVVSEKTAGRDSGGSVDLIWINGPNFLAMKEKGLLHGPFTQVMPNYRLVDTTAKRSNVVDFTVPVDGLESPWRLAQLVYVYDSARHRPESLPRSMPGRSGR